MPSCLLVFKSSNARLTAFQHSGEQETPCQSLTKLIGLMAGNVLGYYDSAWPICPQRLSEVVTVYPLPHREALDGFVPHAAFALGQSRSMTTCKGNCVQRADVQGQVTHDGVVLFDGVGVVHVCQQSKGEGEHLS